MPIGELHIAEVNGEDEPTFRVKVIRPITREIVVQFDLPAEDLMRALTGRVTTIDFERLAR